MALSTLKYQQQPNIISSMSLVRIQSDHASRQ
jgi:hypothetical protein